MAIMPFGSSKQASPKRCNRVQLGIKGQYGGECIYIEAVEVPEICLDILSVPNVNHPDLQNFNLADRRSETFQPIPGISLLIGSDFYWLLVSDEKSRITDRLVAIKTKLGWTLQGPAPLDISSVVSNAILTMQVCAENKCDSEKEFDIRNFWNLEGIGIVTSPTTSNNFTRNFIDSCIKLKGDRYEVSLPWKDHSLKLHDNKVSALIRLNVLRKRLLRDNYKLQEYDNIIREYLVREFAEIAPKSPTGNKVYYMPHRAVYRNDKATTKVRIVFDASAHEPGLTSLNDHLHSGENLNTNLLTVLLNFRMGHIGIIADIEKAFMQVQLSEEDKDSHRFLWYKDPLSNVGQNCEVTEFRMCRVTFGVTCSPFLLASTILKHLELNETKYAETCAILRRSFYVDDLVTSVNDKLAGEKLYHEAKTIMDTSGMNLRKWVTNSADLRRNFPEGNSNEILDSAWKKVLGVKWNTLSDELKVDIDPVREFVNTSSLPTKRNILKLISRIYDPLGLLGPFTVRLKLLLQSAWKLRAGWDDLLPSNLANEWSSWCSECAELQEFAIPRCVFSNLTSGSTIQLHIFADASPRAYGAIAYLRSVSSNCQVSTFFLCSKNRISPLHENGDTELSLPKLELTAALIAARLQDYLVRNLSLEINDVYLWTDSKIVLYWITGNEHKLKPYIRNRVLEIKQLTASCFWRHCPGKTNPADFLTRGINARTLIESSLWLNGPSLLQDISPDFTKGMFKLEKASYCFEAAVQIFQPLPDPILTLENFSNLQKLLRVTAYVYRFIMNSKLKEEKLKESLSVIEIQRAETYWIKYEQMKVFSSEICSLSKGNCISPFSKILTLAPYLNHEGIICVGSRLRFSQEPENVIHPIILPKNSHLCKLLVQEAHQKLHHSGVSSIVAHLRSRFWIIKARQLVKRIINSCVICRRLHGKPYSQPVAPLPRERLVATRPFETTGIDFAGPLYVNDYQPGGTTYKVYIMITTCAVIRAIHLELLRDLSVESCMNGIRRMVARRGAPSAFWSDNAKTFKRAALELRHLSEFITSPELQHYILEQNIQWHFIVERAAWWGGWWERLVRTVKNALKATIGRQVFNFDRFHTLLTEVEATVNARPLTYVSDDPTDLLPLSPSHFLLGTPPTLMPVVDRKKFPVSSRPEIIQGWKLRQGLINKFWTRWSTDYLQQLRSAHHQRKAFSSQINIGDVVLIHEASTPRLFWKLARVENVYHGRDGKIRACEVTTRNGFKYRRAIQHLYPLELQLTSPRPEDVKNTTTNTDTVTGDYTIYIKE